VPVFRAKTTRDGPMDASAVFSMQLMLSKFEYDDKLNPSFRTGAFELPVGAMCPPSVTTNLLQLFLRTGWYITTPNLRRQKKIGVCLIVLG
jgi:hypothetical protein